MLCRARKALGNFRIAGSFREPQEAAEHRIAENPTYLQN
jgi:hypothetical protein